MQRCGRKRDYFFHKDQTSKPCPHHRACHEHVPKTAKHDTLSHSYSRMTHQNVTKTDYWKIKHEKKPFGMHFV